MTAGLQHKGCNFRRAYEPTSASFVHCRSRLQPRQTYVPALYNLRLSVKFDRYPARRTVQTRAAQHRATATSTTEAANSSFAKCRTLFSASRSARFLARVRLQTHAFRDAVLFDLLGFEASAVEVERVAILRHHAHHILRRSFGERCLHLERHLDPRAILGREMGDDGFGDLGNVR